MKTLGTLLLGYVLAAPLTTKISLDLRLTEWAHIGTYFWWFLSGSIWGTFVLVALGIFSILARKR